MKLYHGSNTEIRTPDLSHSRKNVDFGRGFYVTPIYEQAEKWCKKFIRKGENGIVSVYDFDENAFSVLKTLSFDSYSETWLDFILDCRSGRDKSGYDLVSGGVANDKVFNTVELYFDGLIEKSEALKRLKFEKPNLQLCFRSEKSLEFLKFERSEKL